MLILLFGTVFLTIFIVAFTPEEFVIPHKFWTFHGVHAIPNLLRYRVGSFCGPGSFAGLYSTNSISRDIELFYYARYEKPRSSLIIPYFGLRFHQHSVIDFNTIVYSFDSLILLDQREIRKLQEAMRQFIVTTTLSALPRYRNALVKTQPWR